MAQPWAELITRERVLELHQEGMIGYGDEAGGVPDSADECVDGAIGNAWTAALYREPEEAVRGLCFLTHLLMYLVRDHCFTDGNKRVAWLSAMEVLASKRLTLAASADEAEDFMRQVIVENLSADEVTAWMADRLEWIH